MDKEDFDYEEDLAIDPHALDEEWLKHPQLCFQYSKALAQVQEKRDKAKEKVEVARAETERDIRKDPNKYGVEKVTEAAITAALIIEGNIPGKILSEAKEEFIEANFQVNLLQGAVKSFDPNRRKALENLVQLHIASYFAGPKEPRNLPPGKRMADKARDKVADKQREGLNRRRRAKQ